jgi:hypothetical protein
VRTIVRAARTALLVVLVMLALFVAACGRKAPPVAPQVEVPVPLALAYRAVGNTLELGWTFPPAQRPPEAFRVLRARVDTGCPQCPVQFEDVGVVGARPGEAAYAFRDEGVAAGGSYIYQVTPLFPLGVEGPPSALLNVIWRGAPPPRGVVAVATEGGMRVFWEPEIGAWAYGVWRGAGEGRGVLVRLGEAQVPPYTDTTALPDHTYRYAVATITQAGEGPPSAPAWATVPPK